MAGSAVAIQESYFSPELSEMPPLVFEVPKLPEDILARAQAERLIKSAGFLAVAATEADPKRESIGREYPTFMHAIKAANQGDKVALRDVTANVTSDVIERTYKAGMVTKITIEIDERGELLQHGQSMNNVYVNNLVYGTKDPAMLLRSVPETRNGARIERFHRLGMLDDYDFVVFSAVADNMDQQALIDAGFFVDTMSYAIQATSSRASKSLVTQSAFVAGKRNIDAERHDLATIVKIGAALGVDYTGKSVAEIIDIPLLIHKKLIPNGVIDLVKLSDEIVGSVFFGQDKPVQDYDEYVKECARREVDLQPAAHDIVQSLLAEADQIIEPAQAVRRLHELSQQRMVNWSIEQDTSIDARVFGVLAAPHIEQARLWHAQGDQINLEKARQKAQDTAQSSSCPSGSKDKSEEQPENNKNIDTSSDKIMKCVNCPKCRTFHEEVKPVAGVYKCKNKKCGYKVKA